MSSSVRRVVVVGAVSAVVVLGLPLAAQGNSIRSQMDNAFGSKKVTLYGPHPGTNTMSIKNDGFNTTVALEAGGTSDIDSMFFEFSTNGGASWSPTGGVLSAPNDDGAFTQEWNPLASGVAIGQTVSIRANGHSTQDGQSHTATGIPLTVSNTQDVMSLTPGNGLGYWKTPGSPARKVVLSGRASYNGTGTIGIGEPVTGTRVEVVNIPVAAGGWKAVYDIQPAMTSPNFDFDAPDQLVFSATPSSANPTASDIEAYTVYKQVLTDLEITATPTDNNPATQVPVTIRALDQLGNPIMGVNVSSTVDGVGFTAEGQTNIDGIVDANTTTPAVLDYPLQSVNDGIVQYIGNVAVADQTAFNPAQGDIRVPFSLSQQPISVSFAGHSITEKSKKHKKRKKHYDVLEVSATAPVALKGAAVTLWTKRHGKWVQIGIKNAVLNAGDVVTFKIKDRNGRKKTTYQAKIGQTHATLAGQSQILPLR